MSSVRDEILDRLETMQQIAKEESNSRAAALDSVSSAAAATLSIDFMSIDVPDREEG